MAPEPDVRPVGWVTDQPGVTLRRRRNPLLLVIGVALVAGGAAGLLLGTLALVGEGGPDEDDIVAEGTVAPLDARPTETARFTAGGADPFTVWIRTDGIGESNERERVVAATACEAGLSTGDPANFRGSRQGHSVTIGDQSTVGWFTAAEGTVEVACGQVPFGRGRLRGQLEDEHRFVVARGKPSASVSGFALLFGGIVVLIGGIMLLPVWHRGRLRPV